MSNFEIPKISKEINSDNYLLNCYLNLTRIKEIHLLFVLIEILLNIFYELEIFMRGFQFQEIDEKKSGLNFVLSITNIFQKIPQLIKIIILIAFILFFDSLAFFIKVKRFKEKHIRLTILVDIIEIIFFRTIMLFLLIIFFTLKGVNILIGCLFVIPHIYYTINNFAYNHLYYYVPVFIKYPYDEFSSSFDIILIIIKIILSMAGTTNNSEFGQVCFLILFFIQILFSFYFINKLKNQSYLFMKNSFLNRTRLCLFFTKTVILFFALLFGKDEIMTVLFLIVCIIVLLIIMAYIYFIYNPYMHIKVRKETPLGNIFFYLFILSEKNDYDFFFENKLNEHYDLCGICNLCKKIKKYLKSNKYKLNSENEENETLINEDDTYKNNEDKNKDKIIDLFDIIYDKKNKYFKIIQKIILNYKYKGKVSFINNSFFFINLSYLIYSDYQQNNLTLSLNERIILEVINQENKSFIDNHESQIKQLLLCNNFIDLSNKVLIQLKDIINSEPNFNKAKKLIELTKLLNEMKNKKYKENLFSHKVENLSNSRHLILICSLIFEEIFNTSINNSQLPIRDNIQIFEDIFIINSSKINKLISLAVDIKNKSCRILKAGKELYSYINTDLFDLFPLIFKEYQINLFISSILDNNKEENNNREKLNNLKYDKKETRISLKYSKGISKTLNNKKNKKESIEIKLIISENISSKMYYKLLTLKLIPLFNNDTHHFILFDGTYFLHKYTLITLHDYEDNLNAKETLIGVSVPDLEYKDKVNSLPFKQMISMKNSQGFISSKIASFNISLKLYNIYILTKKQKESEIKKKDRKGSQIKISKLDDEEEEEEENPINKNTKVEKIQFIEDNASVSSAQTGTSISNGYSGLGIRNNKKENIYDYGGFNRLKIINYLSIFIVLLVLIIEYFYLRILGESTYNNNISLIQFREFSSLYYRLFSSIIGVNCIFPYKYSDLYENMYDNNCINLINIFTNSYFKDKDKKNGYFNFTLFSIIQNEIFAKEIMEKRQNLLNIHKNIGSEEYNKLFGKEIKYLRLIQDRIKNKTYYSATRIKMDFSEAIILICNSFKTLANEPNSLVVFLDKKQNPFYVVNSWERGYLDLNEPQKVFYEMIMNYKYYYQIFEEINDKLVNIIMGKSNFIQTFIFISITFNTLMIEIIGYFILLYTLSFENISIKIINFINMTINIKNEDFIFSEVYTKKIENLETILQFYKKEPSKSIQNLNIIYNKYHLYLTTKNKNHAFDINKKNYKKIENADKRNELDNIPKNQRIITKKNVRTLGLTFYYLFLYFFNSLLFLIVYVILLIMWINYFSKKKNLYYLVVKNMTLETSIYRAINAYDLMIFQNFTIDEVTELILPQNKTDNNVLLKSFYNDLKLAFTSKKEKKALVDVYSDIEDKTNFTCENLFSSNNEIIQKIENNSKSSALNDISNNLISICKFTKIDETNDFRTVFERHFQYIRNGILSLSDFSYYGLLQHLTSDGTLPRISLFFATMVINVLHISYTTPNKDSVKNLINKMKKLIELTEVIYFLIDIIAIFFVSLFYIPGINKLCKKILILRKVFKIYEIQE